MKRKFLSNIIALLIFVLIISPVSAQILNDNTFKFGRTLDLLEKFYVDTVNVNSLTEKAIIEMLRSLDPHSVYVSAKDVKDMNEPLQGNFEGIGIQFSILHDTIIVVETIPGGPSEKVGLLAGDRILTINGEKVTGIGIVNTGVRSRLMGPKGTKVNVSIFRKGRKELLDFTIIRDKIPYYSLDASYMLDKETGYIKLNKFAATTEKEFVEALNGLRNSKMQNLILDLRGNPGGYMLAAVSVVNQFLTGQKLVVYMQGRKTPREEFKSSGKGILPQTRLIVLTDGFSASASEIVAGAIQDWDRGIIMGHQTFGKGLVQNGFYLNDGSMIRLTIARYYTPTGRSIQMPYSEGYTKYYANFVERINKGETMNSIRNHIPDSLKFTTNINHRIVYGGGGIIPDIFVADDTTYLTDYYRGVGNKSIFGSFSSEYVDKNRAMLKSTYKTFDDFKRLFEFSPEDIKTFIKMGEDAGVKYDEKQFNISRKAILKLLEGLVARDIWQTSDSFQIFNEGDVLIEKALKVIADKDGYNKILGY
jgi:carboxyl-terminal processing protease